MNRIRDYLEETNVQLGASYDVSRQSTSITEAGNAAAAAFMNANPEEIGTQLDPFFRQIPPCPSILCPLFIFFIVSGACAAHI